MGSRWTGGSWLRGGLPRVLANHNTVDGRLLRRSFQSLERTFGPFTSEFIRFQAARVALLEVSLRASSRALDAARRHRSRGKGRRPSVATVEKLSRRVGLDDASYQTALDKFRSLLKEQAAEAVKAASPGELLARVHAEMTAAHARAEREGDA